MGSVELQASSGLATTEWHGINWAACQRRVRSLQRRIVQAVKAGAWRKAKRLSYLLVHSLGARALEAVRKGFLDRCHWISRSCLDDQRGRLQRLRFNRQSRYGGGGDMELPLHRQTSTVHRVR